MPYQIRLQPDYIIIPPQLGAGLARSQFIGGLRPPGGRLPGALFSRAPGYQIFFSVTGALCAPGTAFSGGRAARGPPYRRSFVNLLTGLELNPS